MGLKNLFLVICGMITTVAATDNYSAPIQAYPLTSGVVFEKIPDVVHTPYSALVSVDLDLDVLADEDAALHRTIVKLLSFEPMLHQMGHNETLWLLKELHRTINGLRTQLRSILDAVPHKRSKRAWVGAGGSLLKTVFGTPDQNDAKQWNRAIHENTANIQELESVLVHQQVRITHVESNLLATTRKIHAVATELIQHYDTLRNTVQGRLFELHSLFSNLTTLVQTTRITQTLLLNVQTAQSQLQLLHSAIQLGLRKRLSPQLIPAEFLLRVLRNVSLQIQSPAMMIHTVTEKVLPFYYSAIVVSLSRQENQLKVTLSVPVTCASCMYECYKIHSFPVPWKPSHQYLTWKVQDYLVISTHRQVHTTLTHLELQQCSFAEVFLCTTLTLRVNHDECEASLFLAESPQNSCTQLVTPATKPMLRAIGNNLLYVFPTTLTVTFVCHEHGRSPQTYRVSVSGAGLFMNSTRCDASTLSLRVPARLSFTTHTKLTPFSLYIPELPFSMSPRYNETKLPSLHADGLIHSLATLVKHEKNEITLDRAIAHINDWHHHHTIYNVVLPSVTVPVLLLLALLLFYVLRKRSCRDRHRQALPEQQPAGTFQA